MKLHRQRLSETTWPYYHNVPISHHSPAKTMLVNSSKKHHGSTTEKTIHVTYCRRLECFSIPTPCSVVRNRDQLAISQTEVPSHYSLSLFALCQGLGWLLHFLSSLITTSQSRPVFFSDIRGRKSCIIVCSLWHSAGPCVDVGARSQLQHGTTLSVQPRML